MRSLSLWLGLMVWVLLACDRKDADPLVDEPLEPAATEVGAPAGPAVKTSIGTAGGTLASADGRLTIDFPAGALAAETEISVEPISNYAHGAIGAAYRIGPSGLTLATPVTLTFHAPEAGVSRTGIGGLGIATQDEQGFWAWQTTATRDEAARTVSVQTSHFSDWSLVEGVQLMPLVAMVQEGSSLGLSVVGCYPEPAGDGIAPLGNRCDSRLAPLVAASDWSVNGQPGGNGTVGTVSGSGQSATYQAPGSRPNPSTVAVSVKVGENAIVKATTLVSNLSIGAPATFHGSFQVDSRTLIPGPFTAHGEVAVTPARFDDGSYDDGIDLTGYDVEGSITLGGPVSFGEDAVCTAVEATRPITLSRINLWKQPWSFDWAFSVDWALQCQTSDPPTSFESALYFTWIQGCLPTTVSYYPVSDPNHLQGSFTRVCDLDTTTVSWDFAQ